MIDLHCHILPGVDDGPENLGAALQLARAAASAGTRTIVATPHVDHVYVDNQAAGIAAAVADLQRMLVAAGLELEIRPGAEVALTRAIEMPDAELNALRLGGGPYLLIECPNTPSATGFAPALEQIQSRGHRIVLAHAERIPGFQRDLELVSDLVRAGMLVQITASAIAGRFGGVVRDVADRLLRAGLVHNVASDAHSAERRGPGIAAHLHAAGWGTHVEHFARVVPAAILDGGAIPAMPPPPARSRRGLFRRAS